MARCRPGDLTCLSQRETQIARLYVDGRSYKEIARALGIAPATVRTHINSVYRKLEVTSRIELLHRFSGGLLLTATLPAVRAHGARFLAIDGDAPKSLPPSPEIGSLLRRLCLDHQAPAFAANTIDSPPLPTLNEKLRGVGVDVLGQCLRWLQVIVNRGPDAARVPAHRRQFNATSDELVASIEITRLTLETVSDLLGKTVRAELDRFDGRVASPLRDGLAEAAATQFVRIDGKQIAYRSLGEDQPGAVPIVLLHRFRASMDDWDPALIDAVARDRRVILFDNVGVGESDGQTPGNLEQIADDAASFVRALGLTEVDFLGWSMGGMTAQILAAKHPDLVRKLALIATLPPGGSPEVVVAQGDWMRVASKPTYTDEDLLYLFFSPSPEGVAAGLASLERTSCRRKAFEIKTRPETMQAQYGAATSFFRNEGNWYERLKSIQAPTLVANGDEDPTFPAIDSVVLAREIPNAQLALYPDSGHGFHFQYPGRFAADLRAFLRR